MRKRFAGLVVLSVIALSAAGPSSASAATEFGDNCVGNLLSSETSPTLFEISGNGNPLPTAAPVSGVLTQWKVSLIPTPFAIPHNLKLLRPAGGNLMQIVAEASGSIAGGQNAFDARIPIQAGDRLGLFGTGAEPFNGTLHCSMPAEQISVVGGIEGGGGPPGSTAPFMQVEAPVRIPVAGVIEPDADGDGFGDETQDKCPQSAGVQAVECPVAVLDSLALSAKRRVVVYVTASTPTPVTVSATAKLPKARKKASRSAQARLKAVTKPVTPGQIAKFTLSLPRSLRSALKALPRRKAITLNLQATATNVAGSVSTDRAKLKLRK
jgi:hypothetical protein